MYNLIMLAMYSMFTSSDVGMDMLFDVMIPPTVNREEACSMDQSKRKCLDISEA